MYRNNLDRNKIYYSPRILDVQQFLIDLVSINSVSPTHLASINPGSLTRLDLVSVTLTVLTNRMSVHYSGTCMRVIGGAGVRACRHLPLRTMQGWGRNRPRYTRPPSPTASSTHIHYSQLYCLIVSFKKLFMSLSPSSSSFYSSKFQRPHFELHSSMNSIKLCL